MAEDNQTKNTTILAMDVVGYSAKMNEDERGTTEKLKNARVIIEKLVKQESGRIFNTAGDSFMIEFNSTYSAVNTAIKIQKELHQINNKFELEDKLEFRMGVNLGDVIIDGTNLLGDMLRLMPPQVSQYTLLDTSRLSRRMHGATTEGCTQIRLMVGSWKLRALHP